MYTQMADANQALKYAPTHRHGDQEVPAMGRKNRLRVESRALHVAGWDEAKGDGEPWLGLWAETLMCHLDAQLPTDFDRESDLEKSYRNRVIEVDSISRERSTPPFDGSSGLLTHTTS
jgi:hypothetical protein